jgi:hypothetical protein
MGEPASSRYGLFFDVEVNFFGAMENAAFKQHKKADLCGILRDSSEEIGRLRHHEITVQLDEFVEPAHPESFDDC